MSRFDDILTSIAARYADGTVSFEAGKLVLNKHVQQRKIILTRQEGTLRPSEAPGRVRLGTPISGAGTVTTQRFERTELIEATLRAEDEDALDLMFDRFVNAVFDEFGPNAFEETNEYQWHQGDSTAGGDWVKRNPAIKLLFRVRLRSVPQVPKPYAVVASIDASAGAPDELATDGVTIITP